MGLYIRKPSSTEFIWTFITCYILSSITGGIVSFVPKVQWMLMTPIWFLVSCYIDKRFAGRLLNKYWSYILFLLILYGSTLFGETNFVNPTTRGFTVLFIALAMYEFLNNENFDLWVKPVVTFFLVEHLFQVIYTILLLHKNPILIRELLNSVADKDYPFAISFAGIYLSIVLQCYFLTNIRILNKKYRLLIYSLLVLQFYMIMKANLATAIIILILGMCISIFIRKRKTAIIVIVFTILGIIWFQEALGPVVGKWLVEMSNGNNLSLIISDKLYELGMALQGVVVWNANATFSIRIERLLMSWNGFLQHPLWGTYGRGLSGVLGGHTTWVELLGMFGLIRGLPIWVFFITWLCEIFRKTKYEWQKNGLFYAILIFFVEGWLNPIIKPGVVATVFLIVPLAGYYFNSETERESKVTNIGS